MIHIKNAAYGLILSSALLLCSCSAKVELLQGVSETEANEALAALLDAGINASKLSGKEGMVGIEVGGNEVARAISVLRAEGLPKERYAKMGEVFRKEGLISSPLEERARYIWALSQELSATVSQIDGVLKARVHVVLPERGTGGDPIMPSSAAVFIKHKAGVNLDEAVAQVRRLVANSIPGLSSDKVTVILLPTGAKIPAQEATQPQENTSMEQEAMPKIIQTLAPSDIGTSFLKQLQKYGLEIMISVCSVLLILLGIFYLYKNRENYKFPFKKIKRAIPPAGDAGNA